MKPMRTLRLKLAQFLWPKDVRQGELFTVVRHLWADGKPNHDGSWIGDTLRADIVEGDRIKASHLNHYATPPRFEPLHHWFVPSKNCLIKPVSTPLSKQEAARLYEATKA